MARARRGLLNNTVMKIFLASGSPRRRELLGMLGVKFEIAHTKDVEECYPAELDAMDVAPYLSRLKAEAYAGDLQPDQLYITADTVVIVDGNVIGKPADEADACRMLRMLSGRTHLVVTGVTVMTAGHRTTFSTVTEVEFGELTDREIEAYVREFKPLDKAGAYGIQERIGAIAVKEIRGSFYNVMGLPVHRLYQELKAFGV